MCGIWTLVNLMKNETMDIDKLFGDFWNLKHRGPDNSYFQTYKNVIVGFHRLSIVNKSFNSNQPFMLRDRDNTIVCICNGEIYNYHELIDEFNLEYSVCSDCIVIPELYRKYSDNLDSFFNLFENKIKGEFAFILMVFNKYNNLTKIIIGRDQIGIRPLYHHPINNNSSVMIFTSEIKGANSLDIDIEEFPPGYLHYYELDEFEKIKYIEYNFRTVYDVQPINNVTDTHLLSQIKYALINSVKRRLSADRPLAFLLSGGIDSSLVASIAAKILGYPIRTFCCGMNEGTDLIYARKVAKHIGSEHTEVFFTPEEGLEAIKNVIWTTETWDTTTIRASVGQYLVAKHIGNNTDAKVVLVGEGPDEVCSSYLFNWYAPSGTELHEAAIQYVENIHYFDGRRSDRCIARWGLEARVPLLDPEFIKAYWNIPSEYRMPKYKGIEKWWLRQSFVNTNILPNDVLWRKKEAFSDGVSSKEKSWYEIIQEHIETLVTDEQMSIAALKFPYNTPVTKEAYYYRSVFCDLFGFNRQTVLPCYWQPKWDSDGKEISEYIDPSARVLKIYES
jgi:asparagine synthase (glutamine-hydrolysing)